MFRLNNHHVHVALCIKIVLFAKVLPKDQAEIQKLTKEVELLRVSVQGTLYFVVEPNIL